MGGARLRRRGPSGCSRWKGMITRRVAQLAEVVHAETGKPHADAMLEIVLAIDHLAWAAKHAGKVLGRRKRSAGLLMANQSAHRRVPAARRGRRDRPVELPGLHADGLDRLRARGRQRRGVQAERVHPRRRRSGWSTPSPRPSAAAGAPAGHRRRRDRRGAVPLRRRQARLHRLAGHRRARSWPPAPRRSPRC